MFKQKFGFTRQPETVGFLTRDDLERAAVAAGLAAHITKDVERWDTRLRRARIQWRTRREPARFPLIILDVDHRG